MINHTAMEMAMVEEAVVDEEGVAGVGIIAHTAVGKGTTITVVVVLAMAVVEAEAVVSLNHHTRPNQYATGVEWITIGQRIVGLRDIFVTSIKRARKGRIQKPIWSTMMGKTILIMTRMTLWIMRLQIA